MGLLGKKRTERDDDDSDDVNLFFLCLIGIRTIYEIKRRIRKEHTNEEKSNQSRRRFKFK